MTEEESIKEGYVEGRVLPFIVMEESFSSSGGGFGFGLIQRIYTPKIYYYRVDQKGQAQKGHQEHYHFFTDEQHRNELFAINKDGSFHDGTSFRFRDGWLDALKKLGVETENIDKKYVA